MQAASRARLRAVLFVLIGVGLVAASGVVLLRDRSSTAGSTASAAPGAASPSASPATGDALQRAILTAQAHLRDEPQDWRAWANLGSAYVQQARITADPSYYPRAEGALQRSLDLRPAANPDAFVGMGALASARHDFTAALDWGKRAQATAPDTGAVYGVIDDALTQLGRYPEARTALQRMLDLQPSVASFSRASYDLEEHGDVAGARAALERALADATTPADIAFCRYYLGELAFNSGQLAEAAKQYGIGRQADPSYFPLLEGVAKVEAANQQTDAALRDYNELLARVPLPQYVNEVIDYDQSLGRTREADSLSKLFQTESSLFVAAGVDVDLEAAVLDADHGEPAAAVQHAQLEWGRRHSVLVADALAWALHAAGRDAEALPYADQALALGWRNALMSFHRGVIEQALGMSAAARRDLVAVQDINPYFSTLYAGVAQRALASLGGRP